MHRVGSIMLERLLNSDGGDYRGRTLPCEKGHDIEGTSFSPGLRRIMARAGAYRPFALGHEDIKEMTAISVDAKEIERVSNRLGQQVESFYERQSDPSLADNIIPLEPIAKMYICIDGTGIPIVKAETAEQFGHRIYSEAVLRGSEMAKKVSVIGDGAPWIWNIADEHFYGAIQVIDLYHVREHYRKAAKTVFGSDKEKIASWTADRRKELDLGEVESVVKAIEKLPMATEEQEEILEREVGYFNKNKERMRYRDFSKQGLFVGSGVVEAGCRTA